MAFSKTGVSVSAARTVKIPSPSIGETRDGLVWTGKEWVTEEEWAKTAKSRSSR